MLTSSIPYIRPLGDGLVLKSMNGEADAERLIAFNQHIFGIGDMTRSLIFHHPNLSSEHWLFIEAGSSQEVISSLVVIPWQWRYDDVVLKSGEVGIVGTLESYRNRGLIRTLMKRHHELLREGEFDLSHIQGIPYFYRQFGYEYAMPLEANWQIELRNLPENIASPYHLRRATVTDLPVLTQMYGQTTATLNISTIRTDSIWNYLCEHITGTETDAEFWMVLDAENLPVGYCRIALHGFGSGLIVSETSRLNINAAQTILAWLKQIAHERGKPYIRFNLPDNNDLVQVARSFSAYDTGAYAWQMHIVDAARVLRKLAPVLERRIADSPFSGLSQQVVINVYRDTVVLTFDQGKLVEVQSLGYTGRGDIWLPPLLLAPLILGNRTLTELRQSYPDVRADGIANYLAEVLFPKQAAFIYTIY